MAHAPREERQTIWKAILNFEGRRRNEKREAHVIPFDNKSITKTMLRGLLKHSNYVAVGAGLGVAGTLYGSDLSSVGRNTSVQCEEKGDDKTVFGLLDEVLSKVSEVISIYMRL